MKKLVLFLLFCTCNVEAKFNKVPEDSIWAYPNVSEYMEKQTMEKASGKDGQLTVEDYVSQAAPKTRDDEKKVRQAQKKGTYKSPQEEFAEMDYNQDGLVSQLELQRYYIQKYDVDVPKTKDELRQIERAKYKGTYQSPEEKLSEINKKLEEEKNQK